MSDDADLKPAPLLRKLLADRGQFERDVADFNAEYRSFLEQDQEPVARVLRLHLITEHYLTLYLELAHPGIKAWSSARLSYAQKLELADHPQSSLRLLIPGLRRLNAIRNKMAHRLQFEASASELEPIRDFVKSWHEAGGKPIPEDLELVEAFALIASSWFFATSRMIERYAGEGGLPNLLVWFKSHEAKQ